MGLTSVRTSTPTTSSLEVLPCTLVLPIVCRRKSLPSLPLPSRSRSLLHQSENTLSGSVVPFLLPSPPSSLCGSPRKNTMNPAQELSTVNASKYLSCFHIPLIPIVLIYYFMFVICDN